MLLSFVLFWFYDVYWILVEYLFIFFGALLHWNWIAATILQLNVVEISRYQIATKQAEAQ